MFCMLCRPFRLQERLPGRQRDGVLACDCPCDRWSFHLIVMIKQPSMQGAGRTTSTSRKPLSASVFSSSQPMPPAPTHRTLAFATWGDGK